MSELKVKYKFDSTDKNFALSGDERTVEDSNIKRIDTDLNDERLVKPSNLDEKRIHKWAENGSDEVVYDSEGNVVQTMKDAQGGEEEKSIDGKEGKENGELSSVVSASSAMSALGFGIYCLKQSGMRLPLVGIPATWDLSSTKSSGDVIMSKAAGTEALAAIAANLIFDPELISRLEWTDEADNLMTEIDDSQEILDFDIDILNTYLEEQAEQPPEGTPPEGTPPEGTQPEGTPPEETPPEETTNDPNQNGVTEEIINETLENNENTGTLCDNSDATAEFLEFGHILAPIAGANFAALATTGALNSVMAGKTTAAAAVHTAAAASYAAAAMASPATSSYAWKASYANSRSAANEAAASGGFALAAAGFYTASAIVAGIGISEELSGQKGSELYDKTSEISEKLATHTTLSQKASENDSEGNSTPTTTSGGDNGNSGDSGSGSGSGGSSGGSSGGES